MKRKKSKPNGQMRAIKANADAIARLRDQFADLADQVGAHREFVSNQLALTRQQFNKIAGDVGMQQHRVSAANARSVEAKNASIKSRMLIIEFTEKALATLREIREAEQ